MLNWVRNEEIRRQLIKVANVVESVINIKRKQLTRCEHLEANELH